LDATRGIKGTLKDVVGGGGGWMYKVGKDGVERRPLDL